MPPAFTKWNNTAQKDESHTGRCFIQGPRTVRDYVHKITRRSTVMFRSERTCSVDAPSSAAMDGASHSKQQQQLHQPSSRGTVISVRTTPQGHNQTKLAERVGTRSAQRCPPSSPSVHGNIFPRPGSHISVHAPHGTEPSHPNDGRFATDLSSCIFPEPELHGSQWLGEGIPGRTP
jgi:hypothetical protein